MMLSCSSNNIYWDFYTIGMCLIFFKKKKQNFSNIIVLTKYLPKMFDLAFQLNFWILSLSTLELEYDLQLKSSYSMIALTIVNAN